ncbi:MAG: hypothetical protein JST75_22245 [Bacteroidetes bacterium]|nr:hypothetical protein [Bacteroidota bacterium]
MNKKNLIAVAIYVVTIAAAGKASAQQVKNVSNGSNTESTEIATNGSNMTVNTKLVRHFKKDYPQAQREIWYSFNDGYVAKFTKDAITHRAGYNRAGNWQYTIAYYDEKKLPADIRTKVKMTYYDFAITFIQEIKLHDQTVYLVYVQDETTWKILRVSDEDMDVMDEFIKTN